MEPRNIIELLQLMLDKGSIFNKTCIGFYPYIESLWQCAFMSAEEYLLLRIYLDENLPDEDKKVFCCDSGNWEPRKQWLEEQIKIRWCIGD